MKFRILALFLISLVFCSVFVVAESEAVEDNCGFFCKVGNFFSSIFGASSSGSEAYDGRSGSDGSDGDAVEVEAVETVESSGSEGSEDGSDSDVEIEEEEEEVVVASAEEALEAQVEIVEERAVENTLSNMDVADPKCEISSEKDVVNGGEMIKLNVEFFDDSYNGESVDLSCDQYERYGLSGDNPLTQTVSSGKTDSYCDWGSVTVSTVYFYIVSLGDENLCTYPITVEPKGDVSSQLGDDGCFLESVIDDIKSDCDMQGYEAYSLPDENGCETIYCGSGDFSLCPTEEALDVARTDCENQGENYLANTYSEEVEGQDWPCAQVRCSLCPSSIDIEAEKEVCYALGEDWDARVDIDHETTGCSYVVCYEKGSDDSGVEEADGAEESDVDGVEDSEELDDLPPS